MTGELSQEQMEALLRSQVTGRIGCHADGRTFVVPVTYAYGEDGYIYGSTGEGLKVALMRKNPRVCFEVDHEANLAHWESVIIQGRYEELSNDKAALGLTMLFRRMQEHMGQTGYMSVAEAMERATWPGQKPVVYRIRIDEMTGRFEYHRNAADMLYSMQEATL